MEKIEIARRELGAALQLFLDDKCTVSIHLLASAGAEIVESLVECSGGTSFRNVILSAAPHLTEKIVNDSMRVFANAFKHAATKGGKARDDAAVVALFSDEDNVAILFKGWIDYGTITGRLPLEAQAFQSWFAARYGEDEDWNYEPLIQVRSMSYKSSKQLLLQFISDGPGSDEVLGSPKTEAGPLMMPPL